MKHKLIRMKTLDDVKTDMSALYDEVREGATDLKVAAELANIAGKLLKAEQPQLAREIFTSGRSRVVPDVERIAQSARLTDNAS
jgi:hypothetical protein